MPNMWGKLSPNGYGMMKCPGCGLEEDRDIIAVKNSSKKQINAPLQPFRAKAPHDMREEELAQNESKKLCKIFKIFIEVTLWQVERESMLPATVRFPPSLPCWFELGFLGRPSSRLVFGLKPKIRCAFVISARLCLCRPFWVQRILA